MGWDAPWHWVILAILVIALFGYKKLPDAARAMGRSLRIFKTEIKGMSDDDKAREAARVHQLDQQQTVAPPSQQPTAPAAANTPAPPLQGAPVTTPSSTPVTTPIPGEDPRP